MNKSVNMRSQFFLFAFLQISVFPFLCTGRSLENRMESLEQIVQVLQTALMAKDNRISQLENQLSGVNERVHSLELLLQKYAIDVETKNDLGNDSITSRSDVTMQDSDHGYDEESVAEHDMKHVNIRNSGQQSSKLRRSLTSSAHNRIRQSIEDSSQIAFHAYQSSDRTYGTHETMLFDTEAIDLGDGYNNADGMFVAPVTGVYVFSWTVVSNVHTYHEADLIINGVGRGWVFADSGDSTDDHQATGLIIAQVNQGDHVSVRIGDNNGGIVVSVSNRGRTTFTGWMLFAIKYML